MSIKYIPFYKEPIKGQALLDNFIRTRRILKYEGNNNVYTGIQRGMPYYEVIEKEKIGNNSNNLLIRGECISACAFLKEKGITVDLVYIDPPFASGADYAKKIYIRKNPKIAEKIKNVEELMQEDELQTFEEKMYGDIWSKEAYLNWMYENLCAIKSVMSNSASIFVHLDYRMVHYVKILLDEIFGDENFQSEKIKKKATKTTNFNSLGSEHDSILYYTKNYDDFTFNQQFTNLKESELLSKYIYLEKENGEIIKLSKKQKEGLQEIPKGRRFRGVPLINMNQNRPNLQYDFLGYNRVWACSKDKMQKMYDDGLIFQINGGLPQKKGYLDINKGAKVNDLWTDINPVNSQAKEKVDYTTQKPEDLLKRIIKLSSNEGMVVADFFGGSGVTAKVANDLGRNFIHVDVGINSIQTTRDRLVENNADFKILEINDGINLYRNPIQTMDKIKELIPGLKNDNSLNNFWEGSITDTKNGKMPVYIPNLTDSTTRILDLSLINRILYDALLDLDNNEISKVIIYYIDINNKTEIENYINQNNNTNIKVELRDLKLILDNTIVDDQVDFSLHKNNNKYEITIRSFMSEKLNQKIDKYNDNMKVNKKDSKIIQISDEGLELIEYLSLDCTNKEGIWNSDSEIKIDKFGYISVNGSKTKRFWNGKITSDKKPLRLKIRNIAGDELIIKVEERLSCQ